MTRGVVEAAACCARSRLAVPLAVHAPGHPHAPHPHHLTTSPPLDTSCTAAPHVPLITQARFHTRARAHTHTHTPVSHRGPGPTRRRAGRRAPGPRQGAPAAPLHECNPFTHATLFERLHFKVARCQRIRQCIPVFPVTVTGVCVPWQHTCFPSQSCCALRIRPCRSD